MEFTAQTGNGRTKCAKSRKTSGRVGCTKHSYPHARMSCHRMTKRHRTFLTKLGCEDPEENPYKSKYLAREILELAAARHGTKASGNGPWAAPAAGCSGGKTAFVKRWDS